MPSADVPVNFEVWCDCGEGLCKLTKSETDRRGTVQITVDPCPKCIANARKEGYEEGYGEGTVASKSG